MNIFQKQLIINNKSLAELPDLFGSYWNYGPLPAPQKVTIEEFEKLRKKPKKRHGRPTGRSHHI